MHEGIDKKLLAEFLSNGKEFFGWHSGKNTPNILVNLTATIESLNQNIKAASEASSRLSQSVNRTTTLAVIISAIGLLVAISMLVVQIINLVKSC